MEDIKHPSQTFADRNYVWDEKYTGCDQWKTRHYRRKDEWILRRQYLRCEKTQTLLRNTKREQSISELRENFPWLWLTCEWNTQGREQAGRGDRMSENVSNFIKKENNPQNNRVKKFTQNQLQETVRKKRYIINKRLKTSNKEKSLKAAQGKARVTCKEQRNWSNAS